MILFSKASSHSFCLDMKLITLMSRTQQYTNMKLTNELFKRWDSIYNLQ